MKYVVTVTVVGQEFTRQYTSINCAMKEAAILVEAGMIPTIHKQGE